MNTFTHLIAVVALVAAGHAFADTTESPDAVDIDGNPVRALDVGEDGELDRLYAPQSASTPVFEGMFLETSTDGADDDEAFVEPDVFPRASIELE